MAAACDPEWGNSAAGGSAVRLDEADRILHSHDLLGRVIRDLAPELLLEGHHQLDSVEAVGAQIVDEAGVFGHLRFVDAQMLDDDLLDPISDVTHPFLSSVACWKSFRHQAPWRCRPWRAAPSPGSPSGTALRDRPRDRVDITVTVRSLSMFPRHCKSAAPGGASAASYHD